MSLSKRATAEFLGTFWLVLGQRSTGCGLPFSRHRSAGRFTRLWSDGTHDGLCDRTHFRLSLEPGSLSGSVRRQTISCRGSAALHRRASGWGDCRGGRTLRDCQRYHWVQLERWFRR